MNPPTERTPAALLRHYGIAGVVAVAIQAAANLIATLMLR